MYRQPDCRIPFHERVHVMAEATIACDAQEIDLEAATECLRHNVLCGEGRSLLAKNATVVRPENVDDYRPPGGGRLAECA